MYAVIHRPLNVVLFFDNDPRLDGYDGPPDDVVADARLDDADVNDWPDGAEAPSGCVGRDLDDPTRFAVFRSERQCRAAGFEVVATEFQRFTDWPSFVVWQR